MTQSQQDKIFAALQPLYADEEFSTLTSDFVVSFSQVPASPASVDEILDVIKP